MEALQPDEFLQQLIATREAFWEKMNAERKSYGAEKPLTPAIVLRRLQFGVVMERKAAEVTAPWVSKIPDLDLQQPMSEYVVNEFKHTSILRQRITDLKGDPDSLWNSPLAELKAAVGLSCRLGFVMRADRQRAVRPRRVFSAHLEIVYRAGGAIDPTTAAIYRDVLLAEEEGHEWIAPEILKRYATDAESQQKCLAALKSGCELFGRAIQSFNQSMPA